MKTIHIDGTWYDLESFKHPGGNIINYYKNQDASEAFHAFHYRSKKAKHVLKSLPTTEITSKPTYYVYKGDTEAQNEEMIKDFNIWRTSLIERGFFEPSYFHVVFRLMELMFLFSIATFFLFNDHITLSLITYGVFSARCGWVQHECGHNSFTCNPKYDKFIQSILMGFGLSTSASLWNSMHNKHHAATQKETFDIDLDTLPFVAFYTNITEHRKNINLWWIKHQAYSFLVITSGIFVMMSWVFVLHPYYVLKKRKLIDCTAMIVSHCFQTYLFKSALECSILYAYFNFLITKWIASVYLFGHFSISHTFTDTVRKDAFPNWIDYALYHTVDVSTQNPVVSWVMGYLNCQCVHHLFPQMPQFRQPMVSKELELYATKWNKTYKHIGYFEAWYKTFDNLHKVGKEIYSMKKIR
jgi:fatty acid desaturase